MLEISFERLCTSLSLARPADNVPPSVNYALLCPGTTSLKHNEYKIMKVIRNHSIKITVVLSWNFSWQVFTAGQMLRGWRNLSITGKRLLF